MSHKREKRHTREDPRHKSQRRASKSVPQGKETSYSRKLSVRMPPTYVAICKEIGEGDASKGVRKAVKEAGERRAMIQRRGERGSEAAFQALVFGGLEILRVVEERPCGVEEIAGRTGIEAEDVEEALLLMERRGLIEELERGCYRATDQGRYMSLVAGMIDHDLEAIKKGEGLSATIHHAFLAEYLRKRRIDVEEIARRIRQAAEVLKLNVDTLVDILSHPLDKTGL
jgi:predicted transcriptional regulator